MINRTESEVKYRDADWDAKWHPGEQPKPKVTILIAGYTITIEYKTVNRKCYDFMPTPTRHITIDGKRISLVDLLQIINSAK